MILGYNTNGFAHHRLADAVEILAELGYRAIAFTPDVNHLDVLTTSDRDWHAFRELLAKHRMKCAIETGARFVLDPRRKHQPTLVSPTDEERARRRDFLRRSISVAAHLGAEVVSYWSGSLVDSASDATAMQRLAEECRRLSDEAAERNIRIAFEPEPGMFIDTMDKFAELHDRVNHPNFGLTIDVGHLVCLGEVPIREHLLRWKKWLWNIHLDDMRPGVHDHLLFGEGSVNFADVFATLHEIGFMGVASVELSRHSFDAVNTARLAKSYLDRHVSTFC